MLGISARWSVRWYGLLPDIHCGQTTVDLGGRSRFAILMTLALSCAVFWSASSAMACNNEPLRTGLGVSALLSSCRAYELVSPPYKEGYPVELTGYAQNGERAIVYSLGNLVGTEGSAESAVEGSLYTDTRTDDGWGLSPLNPSPNEYVGQIPIFYPEASSNSTLWEMHTPNQSALTRDLYLRSEAGHFALIGPLGPSKTGSEEPSNAIDILPYGITHVVATTSDYDHIVLDASSTEDQWSFDKTKPSAGGLNGSLYEYSGLERDHPTVKFPILVGVTGEKDSSALIGECGVVLGSGGNGSEYNAMSRDGEKLFFTVAPARECSGTKGPNTPEIYLREHGSLSSPEPAKTTDISTSQCTQSCGSSESGKNFEGASEDGNQAFFTSTQKLTNTAIDGTASGTATPEQGQGCAATEEGAGGCNLYMYDASIPSEQCKTENKCLTVISKEGEVLGVAGVASNGARIYYVSRSAPVGKAALVNEPNLYVYNGSTNQTTYIATLSKSDSNVWRREFNRPVEVGGSDGQFLLFVSASPYLDAESGVTQLYEYDAETGELVRVTQGEDGYADDGNAVEAGILRTSIQNKAKALGDAQTVYSDENRLNLSSNGKIVVFETQGELSPRATAAKQKCFSVYEFNAESAISSGKVHLISDGADTQLNKGTECGATFLRMDSDGNNVLFSTADPLLQEDTDGTERDIYDARVEGGFPSSKSTEEFDLCSSEICQTQASSAPNFLTPTSATENAELPVQGIERKPSGKEKQAHTRTPLAKACKTRKRTRMRRRCVRKAHRLRAIGKQKNLYEIGMPQR